MDVLVGTAATLRVDFVDPAGTLVPDANSVTYMVYATDGSQLVAPTAIVTGASDTGVTITVPSAGNTITAPRLFEKRTVIVSMTSAQVPYTFQVPYRVIPFLNISATPQDVRLVFGGDSDEVTDDEIDLVQAYFGVAADVVAMNASASLAVALASGTAVELAANGAIVGKAVMALLPGLRARIAVQRKDGQVSFMRQAIDWEQVEAQARTLVSRGVAAAAGVAETGPTFLAVSDNALPVCPSGGNWVDISNPDAIPTNFDPVTSWNGYLSWP